MSQTKAWKRTGVVPCRKQSSILFVCQPFFERHVLCARREKTTRIDHALGLEAIGGILMLCKSLVQGMGRMKHPTQVLMANIRSHWKQKKILIGFASSWKDFVRTGLLKHVCGKWLTKNISNGFTTTFRACCPFLTPPRRRNAKKMIQAESESISPKTTCSRERRSNVHIVYTVAVTKAFAHGLATVDDTRGQ
jgi:hypothetical protein